MEEDIVDVELDVDEFVGVTYEELVVPVGSRMQEHAELT